MATTHGPWIDVHAHPGQCFFIDQDPPHALAPLLGGGDAAAGLRSAQKAGMSAVSFATVADLAVLALSAERGLHAAREFDPGEARADHDRQLAGLQRVLAAEGAEVARSAGDVERAHVEGRTAVLITCEGGDFIDGDLDRVQLAYEAGMSSLTLVHYRANELGDIQTEPPVHGGLTPFGRDVVSECNRLGVLIDCAHATFDTTLDVIEASTAPVMISHSHLNHDERPHPRLLSAEHAAAVATGGGLVGVWPSGATNATFEDFVDEIVRLVELIGVEHVGIGTDLDANYKPVLTDHAQFSSVAAQLGERGMTTDDIDRVLGGNALELLRRVAG